MGVNINIRSIEEVPEVMREFVSESDGAFVYDADKAFKALVEERNGRRADRKELAAFKAIGLSPDELAKYKAFGKTPEEISELIEKAGSRPGKAHRSRKGPAAPRKGVPGIPDGN